MYLARMSSDALAGAESELVDRIPASYVDWRERADEVETAYRRWSLAPIDERPDRSAAFRAALDEEAMASNRYAAAIEELEEFRRWPHGPIGPGLLRDPSGASEHP
jgi:hypothetical protein